MNNLQYFESKKVLITGASGVVGYNLCKKLLDIPYCEVHVNYLNPPGPNFKNLLKASAHHVFDITDVNKIQNLPEFDIIFHCSGYGQPQKFIKNPSKTFALNTLSLQSLLKKATSQFVFISTSEIYSESEGNSESDKISINPDNSRNCYILSKLFGEALLNFNTSNIDHKSIRLCLCYGPGFKKDDKRVLSEFIIKGSINKEISLLDEGSALRSYIYVDDCIDGILNISSKGKHNLYNIGGKDLVTIKELAESIGKILGCPVKLGDQKNKLANSPNKAYVDISRYESEFGILNKTNLETGLQKCIEWYNKYE
jgi:nucleoside-diphosphate-sugar epimerase